MIALSLLIQCVCFVGILWISLNAGPQLNIYNPLVYYLFFHCLVFVVRPIVVVVFDVDSQYAFMGFYPSNGNFIQALLVSTIGLICFCLPFWLSKTGDVRLTYVLPTVTSAERTSFYITTALLSPILAYSIYTNATKSISVDDVSIFGQGGIDMVTDPVTGYSVFTNNTAYIVFGLTMCGTLALAFAWIKRFHVLALVPLVIYMLFRMSLGGARWAFLLLAASAILTTLYRRKRGWPTARSLVLGIAFLALFSIIGQNRGVISQLLFGSQSQQGEVTEPARLVDSPDFANFEFLEYILDKVPSESGTYTYYTHYLELFTRPIPRILWPGKPIGSPVQLINLNDYGNFLGRTWSAVGDGWISFGWIGVVINMILAGTIARFCYLKFAQGTKSIRRFLAYIMLLPLLPQWARDGGIVSVMDFGFFLIAPLGLWKIVQAFVVFSIGKRIQSKVRVT